MADQTPVDLSLRIRQAAKAKGIDPDTLLNIARAESTLRPQAKSKTSSSRGLFGVIDSTWVQHGGDPARRGDVDEDIRVGAEVVSQNKKRFEKMFKRAPRPAELYAFHVFGAGAAPNVLRADPSKPMSEVVTSKTLNANPYWKNKTVGQVLSLFENKMGGSTVLASNKGQKGAPLIDIKKIRGSIPAMAPLTSNEEAKDRFTPQTVAQLGPSYQAALAAMALGDTSDDDEDEAVTQRLAEKADEAEAAKPLAPRRALFEDAGTSYTSPFDEVASAEPVGLADGGEAKKMMGEFAGYQADEAPASATPFADMAKSKYDVSARELLNMLGGMVKGGASNAESVGRGMVLAVPGMAGDIESMFRDNQRNRVMPTTDELLRKLPRMTRPQLHRSAGRPVDVAKGFEELGTYIGMDAAYEAGPRVLKMLKDRQPVRRAEGSPMFGEFAGFPVDEAPPSATPFADMTKGKSMSAQDLAAFGRIGKEAVSNVESVGRGSVASPFGMAGDIEAFFRKDGKSKTFKTTEDILKEIPRITPPVTYQSAGQPVDMSSGYEGLGGLIDPFTMVGSARKAMQLGAKASKIIDKTRAAVKQGNTPEFIDYQLRPEIVPARLDVPPSLEQIRQSQRVEPPVAQVGEIPPVAQIPENLPINVPQSHFVSKLDQFTAALPGAVTKSQYLNSLKGKFRDYEILRAEDALAGLDANAKLKPADITAKLRNVTPVEDLRTYVIEPGSSKRDGAFYQNMDNPHPDKEVGVINLVLNTSPEAVKAAEEAGHMSTVFRRIVGGEASPEYYTAFKDFIAKSSLDPKLKKETLTTLNEAEPLAMKLSTTAGEIKSAIDTFKMPNVYGYREFSDITTKLAKEGKPYEQAMHEAQNIVRKKSADKLRSMGYDIPKELDNLGNVTAVGKEREYDAIQEAANRVISEFKTNTAADRADIISTFSKIDTPITQAIRKNELYGGQHGTLQTTGSGLPVGFSRFVDVTTNIPGRGETKIMHVAELQSDMLDDLLKQGGKSNTVEKDLVEKSAIQEKLNALIQKKLTALSPDTTMTPEAILEPWKNALTLKSKPKSYINQVKDTFKLTDDEMLDITKSLQRQTSLENRMSSINKNKNPYAVPEAFKGMENSPQVVQQMMIKNAIIAGIKRGVGGITFPGKESAQAQLYEKLPNNLKQVIKDLGPGFQILPIQTESSLHGTMSNLGVVWDPEVAKRALKEGIRFNKGGLVEKNYDDNRRFL